MTVDPSDIVEDAVSEIIPDNKGIYIPKWMILSVITPIIGGGIFAFTYIATQIHKQSEKSAVLSEKLDSLDEKMDSHKELILQVVRSHEKRIDRLEDKAFGHD